MRQTGPVVRQGAEMGHLVLPCFAFAWPPMVQTAAGKPSAARFSEGNALTTVRNEYDLGIKDPRDGVRANTPNTSEGR